MHFSGPAPPRGTLQTRMTGLNSLAVARLLFDAGSLEARFDRRDAGINLFLRSRTKQRSGRENDTAPAVGECRLTRKLLGQRNIEHRGEFGRLEHESAPAGRRHDFEGSEVVDTTVDVHAALIGLALERKGLEILHELGLIKPCRVPHVAKRFDAAGYAVANQPVPLRNIRPAPI